MRLASFALLLAVLPMHAQTSVLFIGNSYIYTNDLPNMLRQLALSLGDDVTVASSAPGGHTLFEHASYAPTLTAIGSQDWDFVVMQEQSQLGALPVEATNTEIGAIQLIEDIEANYECTYPVFYMTWGRQNGDDLNCDAFPFMCTYNGMQQALQENYVYLANMNDAYVSPVGVAWKVVRDTQPSINLYQPDGSHPSVEGTYLAACVFYCTLFQESCVDATFNSSLPAGTAAILRNIASATVLNEPLTWNLDVPNGTSALLHGSSVGPDHITLIHNGEGTHLWTCSNGQSFTTGTVTFTFTTSDTYTVTHTYNDPCGNSDTVTLTFNIVVGLEEQAGRSSCRVVTGSPGTIDVLGVEGEAMFSLYDAQGRMLINERVGSSKASVACPNGLFYYTLNDRSGTVMKGKVVVH